MTASTIFTKKHGNFQLKFNFCREKLEENRKGVGRLKEKKRTRPTQRNKCSKKLAA